MAQGPSYMDETDCQCESCDFYKAWHRATCRLFWLGLVFPPFWLFNIVKGLYLIYKDSTPTRYDEFIQVFKNRQLNATQHASIDEYEFLNVHYSRRAKIYDYVGYSALALLVWTILFLTLVYNFHGPRK